MKIQSRFSLVQKILGVVLAFFAIPLTMLFLFSYFRMETIIRNNTTALTNRDLDILSSDLETQFSRMSEAGLVLAANQKINRLLVKYNAAAGSDFSLHSAGSQREMEPGAFLDLFDEIDGVLTNLLSYQFPDGTQACLITVDGSIFSTWPSVNTDLSFFQTADWLQPMMHSAAEPDTFFVHDSYILHDSFSRYISYVRQIPNLQAPSRTVALLLLSVPEQALDSMVEQSAVAPMASFYIVDSANETIFTYCGTDGAFPADLLPATLDFSIQDQRLGGQDFFVNGRKIGVLDGKLLCLIPISLLFRSIGQLRFAVLVLAFGLILAFSVLTFGSIRHLLQPLRLLHQSILLTEQGNLNADVPAIRSQDELGELAVSYNKMLARVRQLLTEAAENERRENALRFEARMAQINPHFLFNTLNSIKWMAMMAHADHIARTVVDLGRLLEISMNKQGDFLLLSEELDNLRSYLEIQQLRYGDLFSVHYDIAPEAERLIVPILILQPIVENAILHNIEEQETLVVEITAQCSQGALVITVEDNGCGMMPEQVEALLSPVSSTSRKSVFRGIGVGNVNERIQLKYGSAWGIILTSTPGTGTTVTIRLPAEPQKEDEPC